MARKRPVTPDDVHLLSTVADPNVSPDGKWVAYVVAAPDREDDEGRSSVWLAAVDGKAPARRFTQGRKDHSPRWSPDGRHLAFVSDRGEKNQVFVTPMAGGEPRQVTHAKHGVSQPAWSPDGTRIAYAARTGVWTEPKERKGAEKNAPRVIRDLRYKLDGVGFFDQRRVHIFVADVESGKETQITTGDYNDDQPAWSLDGKRIAFVADRERARHQRQWRTDVWSVPAAGGKPQRLTRARGTASHPTFSPDGTTIAFIGHEHGDEGVAKNIHLMLIPAKGGVPRSLSAPLDRPVAGWPAFMTGRTFHWSSDGSHLHFLAGDRGTQAIYRVPVTGQPERVLDGERQIDAFALTPDGRTALFTAAWVDAPSELYASSLRNGRRELNLSHANDALRSSVDFGRVERMRVKSADGLEVEQFVIFPPGYRAGRKYPLAVNVHGGPHSFHPGARSIIEFQALAGKGYVVALPNPRGSTTYGEAFTEACVQDWGGGDWVDILAGVDELVRRGIADADRLYIGGYSFGGFMSTWAVGHTDRFRAAVIGAPVSNQVSMFGTGDIPLFDIHEIGGIPQENPVVYSERSPITHLGPHVATPVLLVHHEGDLRCPIAQSEEIFHALKALGKEVEFVRYPGGFHTYNTHAPSQASDRIRRTIAWYQAHSPKPARKRAKARTTVRR